MRIIASESTTPENESVNGLDDIAVGESGGVELVIMGCWPDLRIQTLSGVVVSTDTVMSGDGNRVTFKRNGMVFRGSLRRIESRFKFKRIK